MSKERELPTMLRGGLYTEETIVEWAFSEDVKSMRAVGANLKWRGLLGAAACILGLIGLRKRSFEMLYDAGFRHIATLMK